MFLQTDPSTWINFRRCAAITVSHHREKPGKYVVLAHFTDGRTWVVSTHDDRHTAIVETEELLLDAGVLEEPVS